MSDEHHINERNFVSSSESAWHKHNGFEHEFAELRIFRRIIRPLIYGYDSTRWDYVCVVDGWSSKVVRSDYGNNLNAFADGLGYAYYGAVVRWDDMEALVIRQRSNEDPSEYRFCIYATSEAAMVDLALRVG